MANFIATLGVVLLTVILTYIVTMLHIYILLWKSKRYREYVKSVVDDFSEAYEEENP